MDPICGSSSDIRDSRFNSSNNRIPQQMKTLVIHPDDRSTDFLRPIYSGLQGTTVITKNITAETLMSVIRANDRIIMLGHGSPSGLFNVSGIGVGLFAIGSQHVDVLATKECIYIWCNADQFIDKHNLSGLYSGMFVSEVAEAVYCGLPPVTQAQVDQSNDEFARVLGSTLVETPDLERVHSVVRSEYRMLAENNDVAKYNVERWYYIN